MRNQDVIIFIGANTLAGICIMAGAYLGLSRWFGAHPYWMVQVAWIGVGAGLALAVLLALTRLSGAKSAFFTFVFLAFSFGAAKYGKAGFAASYAEDWLAGKFWYFGSMAVAAAMFLCLFVFFRIVARKLMA